MGRSCNAVSILTTAASWEPSRDGSCGARAGGGGGPEGGRVAQALEPPRAGGGSRQPASLRFLASPQALVGPGSQPYVLQKRMCERERERRENQHQNQLLLQFRDLGSRNLRPPPGSAPFLALPSFCFHWKRRRCPTPSVGRPSSSVPTRLAPRWPLVQPRPEALRAPRHPPAPRLSPEPLCGWRPAAARATLPGLLCGGSTLGTASLQRSLKPEAQ